MADPTLLTDVQGAGTVGGTAFLKATLVKGTITGGMPDFSHPVPVAGELVDFFLTFTGNAADKFPAVSPTTGINRAQTDSSGVALLPDVPIPTGTGPGTLTAWVIVQYPGNTDPSIDLAAADDGVGPLNLSPDPSTPPPPTDPSLDPNIPQNYGQGPPDGSAGIPEAAGVDPFTGQPAADPYTGVANIDPFTGRAAADPFSGQPLTSTDIAVRDFINNVFSQPPIDVTGIPQDVQDAIFDLYSQPAMDLTGVPQDVQDAVFDAFSRPGVDSDVVDAIYKSYSQPGSAAINNLARAGRTIAPPPPVSQLDYSLYVPPGFARQQYEAALRLAGNPNNAWWERGVGGLGTLWWPIAVVEEVGRSIANIPFDLENAPITIGEHIGRASLWAEQGEYAEATAEGLESVVGFTHAFTSMGAVAAPAAGALESQLAATSETAVLNQAEATSSNLASNAARTEATAVATQIEKQSVAAIEQAPGALAQAEKLAAPAIEQAPGLATQIEKSAVDAPTSQLLPGNRLPIVNPHFEPIITPDEAMQGAVTRISDRFAANPELVGNYLSQREINAILDAQNYAAHGHWADLELLSSTSYGKAVERALAASTKESGLLVPTGQLRDAAGRFVSSPDFRGVGPYSGYYFDVTTNQGVASHFFERVYPANTYYSTYDVPASWYFFLSP